MKTNIKAGKFFIQEVLHLLTGDDNQALAFKILRQADSAFKTQIASLTGDTISLEDAVEEAKESLRLARLNHGQVIVNRNNYISNLLMSQNRLVDAEEALEAHNTKLAFLNEQAALLDA